MEKQKKQFRLYDVYRYATTTQMSNIAGLLSYECNRDATTLTVRFIDYSGKYETGIPKIYFCNTEKELKKAIKSINKQLGNCMTPGRRRSKYVAQ